MDELNVLYSRHIVIYPKYIYLSFYCQLSMLASIQMVFVPFINTEPNSTEYEKN